MSQDLDPARFRELCGRFATGVAVITVAGPDGPYGMTVNSFTSVSLDPPLVSVNIDRRSAFHPRIAAAASFTVNVLSTEQEALSRRFAEPGRNRFDGVGYRRADSGGIVLDGCIAAIDCTVTERFEAGDHTIVIGRVHGGENREGRPLLYFRGGYLTSP